MINFETVTGHYHFHYLTKYLSDKYIYIQRMHYYWWVKYSLYEYYGKNGVF